MEILLMEILLMEILLMENCPIGIYTKKLLLLEQV
jgi:hypothetical protein